MNVAAPGPSRTAVVTGANRGIGRALAVGLAARGFGVGLLGRDSAALDAVAEQCRAHGVAAVTAAADVVDRAAVESAVRVVADGLGGIGLLVNNAGVVESVEDTFDATDIDESWRVVEVNVRGPMLVTYAALPIMLAAGGGRIVNINSGAAFRNATQYTGYGLSKGALARFTALLDAQYRDRGVFAFDVAPGVVVTDMTSSMPMHDDRTEWTDPEVVASMVAGIGEGRLDALSGRFFRAGADTVDSLADNVELIVARDARTLRLAPIDADDPVA